MLETFVAVCESCRSNLTVPVTAQGRVLCCPRCGITLEILAAWLATLGFFLIIFVGVVRKLLNLCDY